MIRGFISSASVNLSNLLNGMQFSKLFLYNPNVMKQAKVLKIYVGKKNSFNEMNQIVNWITYTLLLNL